MNDQYQAEIKIIRIGEAANLFGMAKSSFYDRVKQGLLPSSISLGGRSTGWVDNEVKTVLRAMIRGDNSEAIKMLVIKLTDQRQYLI